jgi:hypothetical protein
MRALAPEGIFFQRIRKFRGWKKRTPVAKAGMAVLFTARLKPCPSRAAPTNL